MTLAGLAQSVERLTAEREVAGSVPRGRTNTQGLKITEKWRGTLFALQAARPSRGSITT